MSRTLQGAWAVGRRGAAAGEPRSCARRGGNDDVAHDKIDDRRRGDGDECADRPAEGGAYEGPRRRRAGGECRADRPRRAARSHTPAGSESGLTPGTSARTCAGCRARRIAGSGIRASQLPRRGTRFSEGNDHGEWDRERHSEHDQRDVRERPDDHHHDDLRPEIPADPQPGPMRTRLVRRR